MLSHCKIQHFIGYAKPFDKKTVDRALNNNI